METEPKRAEIDATTGALVLEFGAAWCPICRVARPLIDRALAQHAHVQHIWIEDGKGKPLGRSFHVKLWPTLIFVQEGREVARVVRPQNESELEGAFHAMSGARPERL